MVYQCVIVARGLKVQLPSLSATTGLWNTAVVHEKMSGKPGKYRTTRGVLGNNKGKFDGV
jgi:hypothetical protein